MEKTENRKQKTENRKQKAVTRNLCREEGESMKKESRPIEKPMTPEDYISRQPEERRAALTELRQAILENLPKGFQEVMQYGMIGYAVPHALFPEGYHANPGEPLPFMGLANQKGYIAIYHMGLYADKPLTEWFEKSYEALGIGKLDMGKSCIRLKKMSRIPKELIGELCTKMTVEEYIEIYRKSRPEK
ncbi:DUF1801 domain-containing protein [Anaerobium acetethylicum]|nr:DUF1801 domain-containing protein [Anaerobium acetethylicum]